MKEHEDEFYANILKFVTGDQSGFETGTDGELQGLIAKRLVAKDSGLLAPERRDELIARVHKTYEAEGPDPVPF